MLTDLRAQITTCVEEGDPAKLQAYAASVPSSEDIGLELEIGFRSEGKALNLREEGEYLRMIELLRFSIEFGKIGHEMSPNIGKIPFLLIFDMLERETISVAERVWTVVEELADNLTTPALFSKGKMTVLRFCNALLRRLSKSCNTEFCGRILMFLAAIYPLSERSAVNISGKSNTSNVTGFEDLEEFEAHIESSLVCGAGIEETDGEQLVQNDSAVEALMAVARGQFSAADSSEDQILADSKEDAAAAVDFNLYKMFWGIQNYVAGDPVKSGALSVAVITEFCGCVDSLLSAFEANAFTDSELEQSLSSWEQLQKFAVQYSNKVPEKQKDTRISLGGSADLPSNHRDSYAGCKYLTSSQLFTLQLKDPVIREQISTQLLFHLFFLKERLPGSSGADKALESISTIENRIYAILRKTPPNGAHFLQSLKGLLDGEQHWSQWKKRGCIPFEKISAVADTVASSSLKRKSTDASDQPPPQRNNFVTQIDSTALQSTLAAIASKIPTFDAHIESYMEAEDPEAGIEEEYHPKNDKVYCWRARRLLANKKIAAFEDMADGDVGKGLKKMQKVMHPHTGTIDVESKHDEETVVPQPVHVESNVTKTLQSTSRRAETVVDEF